MANDTHVVFKLFCCPSCRGTLLLASDELRCGCVARYPVIGGIPDLRLPGPSWIDYDEDRRAARELLDVCAKSGPEVIIQHVFSSRGGATDD